MKTNVIHLDPNHFIDGELLEAAEVIRTGGLVAFPTETVYGLGANALDGTACDEIFRAKGRPHDNPLIVHVLNPEDCEEYADTSSSPLFSVLAERFMPGPLTVILPKKPIVPDSVTVGLSTVALRCPQHPIARALIRLSGKPIAAPSANLSGKPSPTSFCHVYDDMNGRIPMILDGGDCRVGLESTVISLKGDTIHLLRPGFVTPEDLLKITPKVVISPAVLEALKSDETPESPGMKYRHYAPGAPVSMVSGSNERVLSFFCEKFDEGCGILCFDEDMAALPKKDFRVISLGSKDDTDAQAHRLFSALREFDKMNLPHIYARFTQQDRLGLAVSNRLLRACAFDVILL